MSRWNQVFVSESVEGSIRCMVVGACEFSSVGRSTRPGALNSVEMAGRMAGMTVEQRLVFEVVHGLNVDARGELIALMITKRMNRFEWYCPSDRRKQEFRKRINSAISGCVSRLSGQNLTVKDSAASMNLSVRAYNKTWFYRESEIYSTFLNWYYDAEKVFTGKALRQFD